MPADLNEKDYKLFIQFVAENRSYGEFQNILGMSMRDVMSYRDYYKVSNPEDAKKIMEGAESATESRLERQKAWSLHDKEVAKRFNDIKNSPSKPQLARGVICEPNLKPQSAKAKDWEEELAKNKIKNLPEVDEETFRRDATKGLRFLLDKYDLDRKIILGLLEKFKIDMNFLLR